MSYLRVDYLILMEDGETPVGDLIYSDAAFYGMTGYGGITGDGVIFKIDTSSVASINEIKTANGGINVYPNPALNSITVQMQLLEKENVEFILYNTMGEIVYDKKLSEQAGVIYQEINLSLLSNGIYLLKVNSGNSYSTKKQE